MSDYPKFYKLLGRCLKRTTDTSAIIVQVPENGKYQPLIYSDLSDLGFTSKEQIDALLNGWLECSQDDYESYLGTFYQVSQTSRSIFNNYRQNKYNKQNSQSSC